MAEAPELLPCPFCGGKALLTNREMPGCAFVVCEACQAQGDDGSVERVVAKWNTRARDPRVPVLVKAAEALGVRKMVAGWNGEDRETPYTPHPPHLWAKITTTCGAVYALDAAIAAFKGDAQ